MMPGYALLLLAGQGLPSITRARTGILGWSVDSKNSPPFTALVMFHLLQSVNGTPTAAL